MDRVAYKPLIASSPDDDFVDNDQIELGCHNEDLYDEKPAITPIHIVRHHVVETLINYTGLSKLRLTLSILVILLLLFVLSPRGPASSSESQSNLILLSSSPSIESLQTNAIAQKLVRAKSFLSSSTSYQIPGNNVIDGERLFKSTSGSGRRLPLVEERVSHDSYLKSLMLEKAAATLPDDFLIPDDDGIGLVHDPKSPNHEGGAIDLQSIPWWTIGTRNNSQYVTITNYIRAMKGSTRGNILTLTTQASSEFIYHSVELCKRWDGPISVAVYSPGSDLQIAITLIKYMRACLPSPLSACIKDKVTWHLVYDKKHGPDPVSLEFPKSYVDSRNYPLFARQNFCPKFEAKEPSDTVKLFETDLKKTNNNSKNYREINNLLYPINVLRNTAREAATTKYIMASDIELYPSVGLVSKFTNYINRHNLTKEFPKIKNIIFTLPIFEVSTGVNPPKTKIELVDLFRLGKAIFFHKFVCDWCQNFPRRLDWLQFDSLNSPDINTHLNEIAIFEITKRDRTRDSWEPIFIGTNGDPKYDDRLTWEGRRDKMGQMYEMCLRNYHLFVLGNAFLVHTPGIKHIDRDDVVKRTNYMRQNNAIYESTIANLRKNYSATGLVEKC